MSDCPTDPKESAPFTGYSTDQARVFRARAAARGSNPDPHVPAHRPRATFLTCSDVNRPAAPDAYDKVTAVTTSRTPAYDERLTAPRTWWVIAALFGLSMALVFTPLGLIAALIAFAAGTALAGAYVSSQGSLRIRVTAGLLVVGDARIPLKALGETHVLDGEEARAWRTYKADLRAFTAMRSYIPTAIRIEVRDPDDPTPYIYLSTRTPERLAEAIRGSA